jgi:hypothetical protein
LKGEKGRRGEGEKGEGEKGEGRRERWSGGEDFV